MMKSFRVLLASLLLMGAMVTPATAASSENEAPSIVVTGSAEVELEPDYIQWRVTITDNHVDPVKAKSRNDERYEAVLEIADDLDIERGDIVLGQVSIRKMYEREFNGGPSIFKDYKVQRQVILVQREVDEIDEMLEQLAGAKVEFNISYGSSELGKAKDEARLAAVAAAKEKAVQMAGVLGQRVGRPLRMIEQPTFSDFDLDDALSNTLSSSVSRNGSGARYGSLSVRCSVQIEFLLIDE